MKKFHSLVDSSNSVYCADSSNSAYCVVYLKVLTSSKIKVSFLVSKTKVTPLKVLSIPHLELLGVRLIS